jgi:uncharacterized RDD family membrane protein YckC
MSNPSPPAGLCLRAAAFAIDVAVILLLTLAMVATARAVGRYVPAESLFILLWLAYATAMTAWRQGTLGKWALGLAVQTRRDQPPGLVRVLLRESVCKMLAALPLGAGLLWIALRKSKRGWHDYLAGTRVVRQPDAARRRAWLVPAIIVALVLVVAPPSIAWVRFYRQLAALTPKQVIVFSHAATQPTDVRDLAPEQEAALLEWLNTHAQPPEDYTVAMAARHQVTLIGERHNVRDNLLFLQRILPNLYHRAGVRCLAMEVLMAADNAALARLVAGAQFDRAQALALARHDVWKGWGAQEYWEVLEAVWRLNHDLPPDQPRMRLIGLDREWDLPSCSLAGFSVGDSDRPDPFWERLRLVRVLTEVPLMLKRDELMALNLERAAFEAGDRTVVWAGSAHCYTDYAPSLWRNGRVVGQWCRMGAILKQRHGAQVCHLLLHDASAAGGPALTRLIEKLQAQRGDQPCGFDVAGSPLGDLDATGHAGSNAPDLRFADFAAGYIFLQPVARLKPCIWAPDYITPAMFLRHKPFYEAQVGHRLHDAAEANAAFIEHPPW